MVAEAYPPSGGGEPASRLGVAFERLKAGLLEHDPNQEVNLEHCIDLRLLELGISLAQVSYFETMAFDQPGSSQRLCTSATEFTLLSGAKLSAQRLTFNNHYTESKTGEPITRVADYFIDFTHDRMGFIKDSLKSIRTSDGTVIWKTGANMAPMVSRDVEADGKAAMFEGDNYKSRIPPAMMSGDGWARSTLLLADLAAFTRDMRRPINEFHVTFFS